jgi:hypothetical protein
MHIFWHSCLPEELARFSLAVFGCRVEGIQHHHAAALISATQMSESVCAHSCTAMIENPFISIPVSSGVSETQLAQHHMFVPVRLWPCVSYECAVYQWHASTRTISCLLLCLCISVFVLVRMRACVSFCCIHIQKHTKLW